MRIGSKCIHNECKTNSLPLPERKLFCIPRNEDLRRQWFIRMDRNDLNALTYEQLLARGYRVCHLHFSENQFQTAEKKKLNFKVIPLDINQSVADAERVHDPYDVPSTPCKRKVADAERVHDPYDVPSTPCKRKVADAERVHDPYDVPSTPRRRKGASERTHLRDIDCTRKEQLTPRKKQLYARLQHTERLLTLRRKRGRALLKKFKGKKVDILSTDSLSNIENIYALPAPLRIFLFSILRNFHKTKRARRYSVEEKALFLSIMKHGPRCYRYLEKLLSFPSVRTLRRSLENFKLTTGISEQLFCYLNQISSTLLPLEQYCTLIFDEMELKKHLRFTVSKNSWTVDGFVETGTEGRQKLADHVLVFMIRGIAGKWKQPIAFYFTHNAANQYTLKTLIKEVVQAVHEKTKFKIVASVCDGGSWNVAAMRALSIESGKVADKFVYNIGGNEIVHLFDAPHLLKCMRNNFITKNIEFEGEVARWTDIQRAYELDGGNGVLRITKLTNAHVNPTTRQKMKVKLASQVFSQSTAAVLKILSTANVMNATGTAHFVKFMNDLFDSLNSVSDSAKPLARKLTKNSPHINFWHGARCSLERLKFFVENKRAKNPPFIKLLLATIGNAEYLWKSLQNLGFKYVTLRCLNQDPVENLFSIARGLCGGNTRPTTLQFADAYKTVILNNTVKSSVGTNCEDDGERSLITYNLLLANSSNTSTDPDPLNPVPSTSSGTISHVAAQPSSIALPILDINETAYVAGFIIKKLLNYECPYCEQFLCAATITDVHNLLVLREYDDNKRLLKYPSDNFTCLIAEAKDKIFCNIPEIIHFPNILSKISYSYIPDDFCPFHGNKLKKEIIELLHKILLNHFTILCNKKLANLDLTTNSVVDAYLKIIL